MSHKANADLTLWTSEYSVYREMILQMLSRKQYTNRQISEFMSCPVRAVEIIARKCEEAIKTNHIEYVKCRKIADENMKRTQDKAQLGILEFAAGMAQLMTIFGGRRRGANAMRGMMD